jgi:phosphate transport system protein
MSVHLQRAIENLKKQLLSLCALVEDQVQMGVRALLERDETLAAKVQRGDREIDDREVYLEEECLKVLALYQPVAIDLRLVVAALKINNDLERIGDMAVNIARKGMAIAAIPEIRMPFDIKVMAEKVQGMLHGSIEALVNTDAVLAKAVRLRDDEIDRMKHDIRVTLEEMIRRNPAQVEALLNMLAVSRNLERIADMAANIAEDVIYTAEGKIIRHSTGE